MGRRPCCSKEEGLNRGAWTAHEDKTLSECIKIHGEGRWRNLPKKAGLNRCGKSCRLRWLNYLRPDIKRGNISPDEEELIIRLHKLLGNRWSLIAGRLPGRTDNEIKNYWNTNLGKKIQDHQISCGAGGSNTRKRTSGSGNNHSSNSSLPSPSRVVRTKAIKCTKVVLNNNNNNNNNNSNSNNPPPGAHKQSPPSSLDTDHELSNYYPLALQANTLNGSSPSSFSTTTTRQEQDHPHFPLLLPDMNFNSTEELFLSDLLNSDMCDYNEECNNSVLSPSIEEDHQALMFSEDFLLQSWINYY